MPKGYALLVGLKEVDPRYYNGNYMRHGVAGVEIDLKWMDSMLSQEGFNTTTLFTRNATQSNVIAHLKNLAAQLQPGDILLFYYSGHGDSQIDWSGDEEDGFDETLCLYDGQLVDDELLPIWQSIPTGVRILMISDSCHSGTVFKNAVGQPVPPSLRFLDQISGREMRASLIHLGGATDPTTAKGDSNGGVFTVALKKVWNEGRFNGDYRTFFEQIKSTVGRWQTPEMHRYGVENPEFLQQKPFTI